MAKVDNSFKGMKSVYEEEHVATTPLAGAVHQPPKGKKWTYVLNERGGKTAVKELIMEIPYTTKDTDIFTRAHEIMHAHSEVGSDPTNPRIAGTPHGEAVEAIEEGRNHGMWTAMKPHPGYVRGHEELTSQLMDKGGKWRENPDERMRALFALAAGEEKRVDDMVSNKAARKLIHKIFKEHYGTDSVWDYANNMKWAEALDAIYPPPPCPKCSKPEAGKTHCDDGEFEIAGEVVKAKDDDVEALKKDLVKLPPKKSTIPVNPGDAKWCPMFIENPPLMRPSKSGALVRRHRYTDQGAVLKRPDRILTDALSFRIKRKRRFPGGSLLFDVSGSMGLTYEDIEDVLQAAPAATIALYAGDGAQGFLRIVAREGKMASKDAYDSPGGNCVDGPALRWLTTQEEPRYWVSDGQATGYRDHSTTGLREECQDIARQNNITQIHSADEAKTTLAAHKAEGMKQKVVKWPGQK